MKAVLQRVSRASVAVREKEVGSINAGFVVFLGIAREDTAGDSDWMLDQIVKLRVFADDQQKMNRSISDVHGGILLISQFTLFADTAKGRRPSFFGAASPETARPVFDAFVQKAKAVGVPVATGAFGEHMEVSLTNDGPVTILLDSRAVQKKHHI